MFGYALEQRRIDREEEAARFDRAVFDVAFVDLTGARVDEVSMALNDVSGLLSEIALNWSRPNWAMACAP